jgi:hypothetical protein
MRVIMRIVSRFSIVITASRVCVGTLIGTQKNKASERSSEALSIREIMKISV